MKIEQIYEVIAKEGFTALTLQTIDNYIKEKSPKIFGTY